MWEGRREKRGVVLTRSRELWGQAGGAEAVLGAMRGFPEHAGVQSEAMACVCSLAGTQLGGLKVFSPPRLRKTLRRLLRALTCLARA
eukprot:3473181-Rhodomonas_salina.4